MWIRVVQTTAIQIAGLVLSHHTKDLVYKGLSNDPVFSDFWSVMANSSSHFNATHNSIANATSGPISLSTGTHSPVKRDGSSFSFTNPNVAANWTFNAPGDNSFNAPEDNSVSFYKKTLPMEVISCLILSIFQYCWLIGLERAFPARSLKTNVPIKVKVGLDDSHEEEIVQTWIARGRVRRTSLSWCNTFLKWVLNVTIGRLGLITLSCILRRSLGLKGSPQEYENHMFHVSFISICRRCAKLIEMVGGCVSVCVFLSIHRRDSGAPRIYCGSRVQADSLFGGC